MSAYPTRNCPWWTEDKIRYYKAAAERSLFHDSLANLIAAELEKDDRILELGAGLGYATELLSRKGYSIRAIEREDHAVEEANRRSGFKLLEKGDAIDLSGDDMADVVLMLFFGQIERCENLEYYLSLAKKRLIHVSSRHSGNKNNKRPDRTREKMELLDRLGLEWRMKEARIHFNQPLKSLEDASLFFNISYGEGPVAQLYETTDPDYPYEFRNRKDVVIFIIDKN